MRTGAGSCIKVPKKRGIALEKSPTGIAGFDEIAEGGLPRERVSLVCGGAGSGKTLFSIEFIVRGAVQYGEPGVFVSFEKTAQQITKDVSSLGFDLATLSKRKKIALDSIQIESGKITEGGNYDLEGLFIRIAGLIDSIGAKRVALDTIETLFATLPNEGIIRAELRRLFQWLRDRRVTTIVTGEMGKETLTRHGLEEYISDCVIFLDHRVIEQIGTRRLRIVKYLGSKHGMNEYPFMITEKGLSILPITSIKLGFEVDSRRISSGIPQLDEMLGGGLLPRQQYLNLRNGWNRKNHCCSAFY